MCRTKAISILLLAASIIQMVSPYKLRSSADDDIEQSGDFGVDIDIFKNMQPEEKKLDDQKIMKSFANQPKQIQRPKQTNLNEDVNDFIELIPKAEIKAKIDEYYRNDMDTQHIFEFMHSKVFQELRRSVLDMADVKEILQYLNKNGLNVKGAVRKVDNRLGISKIRPTSLSYASPQSLATNTTIGGLNGLVEDILALLPQDEIFILFFEKLDNSPKFASFVQSIGNSDFHRKYSKLWKSKDLHTASALLKKHKIDIVKIIQILQGYFMFGTF